MIFNFIKAVLIKDIILSTKYKLQLLLSFISVFVYLFVIFNFSKAVSSAEVTEQSLFLTNPFLFLISGYMIIDITVTILNIVTSKINFYQTSGMFEEIMSLDNQKLFYLSSFVFAFLLWSTRNLFYIFISFYFFNLDVNPILNVQNIIIFIISFFSIIFFLFGVSFMAASFTIIFKKGNPIIILGTLFTTLFSGAIYPINVLPPSLHLVSNLIPTTHFLNNIRAFMTGNILNYDIPLLYLLFISVIFLVLGIKIFFYSITYSKKTGKAYTY